MVVTFIKLRESECPDFVNEITNVRNSKLEE